MRYADSSLLIKRIEQLNGKEVAFMFGSAMTAKQNGSGIAGVDEVISLAGIFLEEHYNSSEREDYIQHINGFEGSKRYQETLSYISDVFSNDVVFNFIEFIINENKDNNGNQKIPQKVIDLIDLIHQKK